MILTDYDLLFLYTGFMVAIFALIVAGLLNPFFVIRLQMKQAQVRDHLAKLRNQMLAMGFITEIVIIIAIFCLTARFIVTDLALLRILVTTAILFFSLNILAMVLIFIQIYNQNYSNLSEEKENLTPSERY